MVGSLRLAAVLLLFAAGFTLAAEGQTGGPLDLPALTARFLAEAPSVRAVQARIPLAEAALTQARILPNPTLSVDHQQITGQRELTAIAEMPIPLNGSRGVATDVAQAGIQSAEAQVQWEISALVADLHRHFYGVLYLQERGAVLADLETRVAELDRVAALRTQAGQISGLEHLSLQTEGDLLRSLLGEVAAARVKARAELEIRLGETFLGDSPLVGTLLPPNPVPDLETLRPSTESGQVEAARWAAEEARAELALTRRLAIPEPSIRGGAWQVGTPDGSDLGFLLGLSVPLPLFDRAQGQSAAAAATVTQREAELQVARVMASTRLAGHHEAARLTRQRAETYVAEGLTHAELLLERASLGYQEGSVPLSLMMQVLGTTREAREHALDAALVARLAEIDLLEIAGQLPGAPGTQGVKP